MLFNSLQFLLFFIAITTLYFALPHKSRWMLLLTGSCFFYMAFIPVYILILGFTIVIDYYAGIMIENRTGKQRKLFLICSLVANIGVLAVFKYYLFFNENLTYILTSAGIKNPLPYLDFLLPIGLSFHTFQAMSYTIEVYRGNQKAERHFGIYALYVMFYPQLVAGPIERPQNMIHQFHEKHEWDYERFKSGAMMILWGLFKKVVIADRLSLMVDTVYNNSENHTSANIALAAIFFSFQIYCDFSGYSDIAIGTARIMGFKLMENFNTPYFSKSISEFWRRWHISLSSWFKDYLYIPLGGNRVAIPRWYLNILIVFLISGLWHGASWGFIIWGGLHGLFQIVAHLRSRFFPQMDKLPDFLNVAVVFILVTLAWIFFRVPTFSESKEIFRHLFSGDWRIVNLNVTEIVYCFALIVLLNAREYYLTRKESNHNYFYLRLASWIFVIYFFGIFHQNQFIYFQF
jgi:alginate O-acetyltransferase complex protein AlgI